MFSHFGFHVEEKLSSDNAVIIFLGFGSRTSPHVCLGRNIHILKSPRATCYRVFLSIDMIWLYIHKDIVEYHTKWPKRNKILVTVGTWDKITTVSSTLQVWHYGELPSTNWRCMQLNSSEYILCQCSLYFGIRLDHSLTCKHLTKLKSWSVSWP